MSIFHVSIWQKALYTVTNTFEGRVFVSANGTEYAFQLFPEFGMEQSVAAGKRYPAFGTAQDHDNLFQGECKDFTSWENCELIVFVAIFICPTYYLLNAFRGCAFRVNPIVPSCERRNETFRTGCICRSSWKSWGRCGVLLAVVKSHQTHCSIY